MRHAERREHAAGYSNFRALAMSALIFVMLAGVEARADARSAPPVTILKFEKLIDGSGKALAGHEIAVADGRILAVGDGLSARYETAAMRDLDGLTAAPGLIDVHTHITYALEGASHGDAWAELNATPHSVRLAAATRNASAALTIGVTTVRDLNAEDGLDLYLRELINSGVVNGPRMFVSGEGLHPSRYSTRTGARRNLEAELMAGAATQIANGADWVKLFATSGSADDLTSKVNFSDSEIEAAAIVARRLGARIAVHSYGPEAVEGAIKARVNSIEHAVGVDEKTFRKMAKAGIIYVPTVDHNRYYADHRDEYGYDDETEKTLRAFVERNVDSVRLAHRAGVKIAMGSDALMSGFGENTRELSWFAKAGLSPAEIVQTATINGAELLGQSDNLGRLQPGYIADIIGLSGDPLADIDTLISGVQWVMKDGVVVVDQTKE